MSYGIALDGFLTWANKKKTYDFLLIGLHFKMKWPSDKNHTKTKTHSKEQKKSDYRKEIAY